FADREAQLFFHSDWNDQLNVNCYVVARHNHLNAFWKRNNTCHVSCTEVELWTVVGEEWCMAAAFFLVKDVSFCLELLVWLNRTWLAKDLTALNAVTCNATYECADVVASLALIEQLAEHFNASNSRLRSVADTHDFNFFTNLNNTTLNAASHNCTTTRDREYVFDWHQEWLVDWTLRCWDVVVYSCHQSADRVFADFLVAVVKCSKRRTLNDRNIV